MVFLKLLEGIRNPVLNGLMMGITELGSETVLLVLALLLYWCIDKRQGVYSLSVGLLGNVFAQTMKLSFRIPRPWVLDENFTIVEAARAGAGDYSFPSGHSISAGSVGASLFALQKKKWIRVACVLLMILVPLSRMYLGVHTPLDTSVGVLSAVAFAAILYPFFRTEEAFEKYAPAVLLVGTVASAAYMLWVSLFPFPADVDAGCLTEGIKNGWSLLGAFAGMLVSLTLDRKVLHFQTEAPFPAQVLKLVGGVVVVLAVRVGLKAVFGLVMTGVGPLDGLRYFLMVVVAAAVWPMTFPFFTKLFRKA